MIIVIIVTINIIAPPLMVMVMMMEFAVFLIMYREIDGAQNSTGFGHLHNR